MPTGPLQLLLAFLTREGLRLLQTRSCFSRRRIFITSTPVVKQQEEMNRHGQEFIERFGRRDVKLRTPDILIPGDIVQDKMVLNMPTEVRGRKTGRD